MINKEKKKYQVTIIHNFFSLNNISNKCQDEIKNVMCEYK